MNGSPDCTELNGIGGGIEYADNADGGAIAAYTAGGGGGGFACWKPAYFDWSADAMARFDADATLAPFVLFALKYDPTPLAAGYADRCA